MTDQPSNFGKFVGLSGYDVVGDKVVVKLVLRKRHLNQLGLAHGGAIATLADNSMGLAALVAAGRPLVTVEVNLSFIRPAKKGTITGTSSVYKLGEHLAFVQCDITDGKGLLIARATGTYMMIEKAI